MDELRESSLLFSLEGLMETERERVQREAREAQKRREDELLRVAEAAERRRVAQERERESRARREALEREREQLEHERREAMKQASIERARLEADGKLKLIELEQAQKHQLLLAQLREGQRTSQYRALSWLSSAAFAAVLMASLSAYFGWVRPAQAQAARSLQSAVRQGAEQRAAAERALARERENSAQLSARIRQLEAAPPLVTVHPEPKRHPQPGTPPTTRPPTTKRGPCGDSGDPLDNCLH
jgi:colicin import membrane protein